MFYGLFSITKKLAVYRLNPAEFSNRQQTKLVHQMKVAEKL
jgi:hypothetical protein